MLKTTNKVTKILLLMSEIANEVTTILLLKSEIANEVTDILSLTSCFRKLTTHPHLFPRRPQSVFGVPLFPPICDSRSLQWASILPWKAILEESFSTCSESYSSKPHEHSPMRNTCGAPMCLLSRPCHVLKHFIQSHVKA